MNDLLDEHSNLMPSRVKQQNKKKQTNKKRNLGSTNLLVKKIKQDEPKPTNSSCFNYLQCKGENDGLAAWTLATRLLADEALQHHHEAPRFLAEGAVGLLLQEGKQLLSNLGQHSGHVVSCQRVSVVQIHHSILQVAAHRQESK